MGLPNCYILLTPKPTAEISVKIRRLHRLLDSLEFPEILRHEFLWLKNNLWRKNEGEAYREAMELLNELAPS